MKNLRLSAVAVAVGLMVAGAAMAQVNLDASPAAAGVKYASELSPTTTAAITLRSGAGNNLRANTTAGAQLAVNAIGYVRIDISGATFNGTPAAGNLTFMVNDATPLAAAGTIGLAQSSTNYAIFTVTPPAGGRIIQAGAVQVDLDVVGGVRGLGVTSRDGVNIRYRLYDNLGDAVNQNNTTVKDTGSRPLVAFEAGLGTTFNAGTATADVSAAASAYNQFTGAASTAALGNLVVAYNGNFDESGAALSQAALAGTSTVVVTATSGGFAFAANAAGGYDAAARGRVYFSPAGCLHGGANTVASSLTSTVATFSNVPAAFFAAGTQTLCVTARSGGTPLATIGAGTYQLTSTLAPASTATYGNFASPSSATSWSTIRQNGATINIPLAQTPAGFIIRLAVTNSGTAPRAYTVSTVAETGATATVSGALASGEFAAGRLTVIDLPGLLTVTGAPNNAQRSALRMVVNAPASEIRAVYQVTAPNGTSVSNQPLTVE
jgi:hypothetical protein